MFNLYNLLFGSSTRQEETNLNESSSAAVVSQQSTDQCTQTTDNSASNETSVNNNNFNKSKTANHECWILVDDAGEDAAVGNDKCVPSPLLNPKNDMSTSMSQSRIVSDSNNVNSHVVNNNSNVLVENKKMNVSMMDSKIVGSFFEKHQDEDEEFNRKYGSNQTNNNNWLITPLPCLTSIHASQRSIIENDPLENLLIEHPSMSVFVAATSSASNSDQSFQEEEERMIVVESEAPKPVQQSQKPKMTKSEKRKAQIQSQSSSVETSPNNNNKRKNKKNKKSATAVSSTQSSSNVTPSSSVSNVSQNTANQNKENLQVWLANDAKKHALSQQARLEQLLFNKNQMKRANKTKQINANHKQRKYHKLQQPSALSNNRTVF
jgi:hypothetical protein